MSDRYGSPRKASRTPEQWTDLAVAAVRALLEREHAVTLVEMEAKLSDQTYDPMICPDPIEPHHLTTARRILGHSGDIQSTTATTKSVDESGQPD